MSRNRRPSGSTRERQPTRNQAHSVPAPPASPFGPIAAAAVLIALIVPLLLWGNPYPASVFSYWAIGTIVVAAVASLLFFRYDDLVGPIAERVSGLSPRAFMSLAAAVATLMSGAIAIYAFRRFATTSDEIAQLWQARILLTGRWSLPVDVNREFFSLDTVVDSGRWYSQFPIGGPLVLAVGALVGAPWIINPLLAGASSIALYRFVRRAYDERAARWATLLFVSAPMMLLMAGTWMNHVPVLFLATTALAALAEWEGAEAPRRAYGAAAAIGLAVGGIAMIRPLDAVVAALVIGAFQISLLTPALFGQSGAREGVRARDASRRWPELAVEALSGAACIGALLFVNWRTTGAPLRFGYDVAWGPGHRVGFHLDPYGNAHTVARGLDYALSYFGELNIDLTMWPIPAVLVLAAALWAMRRPTRWDLLLLAFVVAQTLAYGAYWYRGELLGPRFLYTVVPALIVLISRAPATMAERLGSRVGRFAAVTIVACVLVAWGAPTSTVGARAVIAQVRGQRRSLKVDIAGAVRAAGAHHALVFLREPFSLRLGRRLWALGVARADAPRIVQTRDACVLLSAIESAERDTAATSAQKVAMIAAVPLVVNPQGTVGTDPSIHVESRASLTPACEAEIEGDAIHSPVPFGAGLVLEPIDKEGRVDGDVVYVADLGAHNEVLRRRFGDRVWYRLRLENASNGPRAVLDHY